MLPPGGLAGLLLSLAADRPTAAAQRSGLWHQRRAWRNSDTKNSTHPLFSKSGYNAPEKITYLGCCCIFRESPVHISCLSFVISSSASCLREFLSRGNSSIKLKIMDTLYGCLLMRLINRSSLPQPTRPHLFEIY